MTIPLFSPTEFGICDVQIFRANGATPQTWNKPRGASSVFMMAIGSGGGGGGGFSGAAGTLRGGGGGGGASGISRLLSVAALLPDSLYVFVPYGGAGGTAGNAGSNGANSEICLVPIYAGNDADTVLRSGVTGALGGQPGTGSAGGAGGTAGTLDAATAHTFDKFGVTTFIAGAVATGGGTGDANGGNFNWGSSGVPLSGGTGGGGVTTSLRRGGNITGAGLFPSIVGVAGVTTPIVDGITIWKPFMACGGIGGSCDNNIVGGDGGTGGIGCGGGGGGGGTTGGAGGRGGDGLVVIISW